MKANNQQLGSIEILELSDKYIKLMLKSYPVALANAIRRAVLSDVPTMAVDFAYFYDNTSEVYDEIIAHRLGLTVLKSDEALGKYRSPEECREAAETNRDCYVELVLEKSVDEASDRGEYVKASDIRTSDPDVKPVYPETPITYLAPGQRLHVVAYARLGRGREHAKWSPASVSILRYTPIVYIKDHSLSEECSKCLEGYPEILEYIRSGWSSKLELINLRNTSGLKYCIETVCQEYISLEYSKSKLILEIESTGALRPERIVYEAIKALEIRLKAVKEALGG